ncbi:ubiquinol-cytochrome c reductase core subunit 1 [Malassezia sp. CBS 17886]|nr:ubiquinol-cytochrome c reductase core subunit 1 [Malassezia sp. CBS 17886]
MLRAVPKALRTAGASRSLATSAGPIPIAVQREGAPVTSVTVAVRAGSRYEPNAGVAHALKNFGFKSTKERSSLRIVREVELNGGVLSASLSKEHLFLTADFLRGDEAFFVKLLGEVVAQGKYCRFEFNEDIVPSLVADAEQAANTPVVAGLEALMATAFRERNVGAPLFAAPSTPVTVEDVRKFAADAFTKENIAIVGSGITRAELEELVDASFASVPSGRALRNAPAKYFGGDCRQGTCDAHGHPLPKDHFFLAYEGAARDKSPALTVLECLLGGNPAVKWCVSSTPLGVLRERIPGARAHAFNTGYSDSGLFGFHVAAPNGSVRDAAALATQALDSVAQGSVTAEMVTRAANQAKFHKAAEFEGPRAQSHEVIGSLPLETADVFAAIDGVKASDITTAVQSMLKTMPTMVGLGDLSHLPYVDELM